MNAPQTDPFAGLERKRQAGMHMATAVNDGAPLDNSLAAFIFMMQHAFYPHTCLIEQAEVEASAAAHGSSGPDSVLRSMVPPSLVLEEWSYLPDEEALLLLIIAQNATEHTQR